VIGLHWTVTTRLPAARLYYVLHFSVLNREPGFRGRVFAASLRGHHLYGPEAERQRRRDRDGLNRFLFGSDKRLR